MMHTRSAMMHEVSNDAHEVGEELPNNLLNRNTLWCGLLIKLGQNKKIVRVNALKPQNFAQYNDTFSLNFKHVFITFETRTYTHLTLFKPYKRGKSALKLKK